MCRITLAEITYLRSNQEPRHSVFHPDVKQEVLDDDIIVFYKITPPYYNTGAEGDAKKVGFDFVAFEWCGCPADALFSEDPEKLYWGPGTEVEVFAHGEAYFDGVRHLWFGHEVTKNEGYHYYPHLDSLARLAKWLQEMEKKHCWDA
jgi:hypothetical protein